MRRERSVLRRQRGLMLPAAERDLSLTLRLREAYDLSRMICGPRTIDEALRLLEREDPKLARELIWC